MERENDIEVYYRHRKGAGIFMILMIFLLGVPLLFCAVVLVGLFGMSFEEMKDMADGIGVILLSGIVLLALMIFSITNLYRAKWFFVAVSGTKITMRDKKKNAISVDVSEIESVLWKFVTPRRNGKHRPPVQESILITTASGIFTVHHHYMDGYREFLEYIKENVPREKFKKIKIDLNK